jgi:hypothetical protein
VLTHRSNLAVPISSILAYNHSQDNHLDNISRIRTRGIEIVNVFEMEFRCEKNIINQKTLKNSWRWKVNFLRVFQTKNSKTSYSLDSKILKITKILYICWIFKIHKFAETSINYKIASIYFQKLLHFARVLLFDRNYLKLISTFDKHIGHTVVSKKSNWVTNCDSQYIRFLLVLQMLPFTKPVWLKFYLQCTTKFILYKSF